MNINPSIAWKANEMVSVGAGINIQHFEVELTNAISYRAVGLSLGAPDAAVPPGSEGVATVEGDDWGIGWNVGLMLSPIEILRIGLSYRSAIKYDLEGTARFANRPAALGPALPDGAIGAEVKLPDMWSAAIAWMPLPQLTVMADYTRTGWDSIQDLRIMRTDGPFAGTELSDVALRFQDSWRSGIGLIWKLDQQWSLRTGYARESSLVVDEFRTPRLPDAKRDWFGVGARYTPAPNWSLDFGLALVRGDDAPSNLPNQESAESLPRGSLVGSYQADATIVAAQLTWGF
jgi:long-chain fatty acid transport protein